MFCPSCGLEDTQSNQFCRACGNDLRIIRTTLEKPDSILASAVSARDEIGRAIASKIRETHSAEELKKVAEDVLPEIEKFLESPAEKRLRRMRNGTIISSIGLGASLMFLLMLSTGAQSMVMIGLGLVTFFLGLGFILNAMFFTVPKKQLEEKSSEADMQRKLDSLNTNTNTNTNELLMPPTAQREISSVTEHTTKHLKNKKPISNN